MGRKRLLTESQKFKRTQPERIANLETIKQAIPLVLNLHPSFWENPKFLRWQLMRLNENYQKDADDLWWKVWTWIEKEYAAKVGISVNAEVIHQNFPPFQKEIKDLCELSYGSTGSPFDSYGDFLLLLKRLDSIGGELTPYQQESFEDWRIRMDMTTRVEFFKTSLLPPQCPDLLMPWTVRFPSFHYLRQLPDWPEQGKKKGRPPDWPRDLLVFELSQVPRMKNMGVASLLFGVKKSTEKWPHVLKHPKLVQIAEIKKAIGKIVSTAYPLSQPGQ